jgi:hypothetical protein
MLPKSFAVWLPATFAAVLAAIATLANLWATSHGGGNLEPGTMVFFCFLPMAFLYAASYQQATTQQIKTLEDRIKILEDERAVV